MHCSSRAITWSWTHQQTGACGAVVRKEVLFTPAQPFMQHFTPGFLAVVPAVSRGPPRTQRVPKGEMFLCEMQHSRDIPIPKEGYSSTRRHLRWLAGAVCRSPSTLTRVRGSLSGPQNAALVVN